MKRLPFQIPTSVVGGSADAAYLTEGEDPTQALMETVMSDVGTELLVTIGNVTMFFAAWEDPDHWAEDWAEELGVELDQAPAIVAELIAAAITDE
jgi:hypothetical protein